MLTAMAALLWLIPVIAANAFAPTSGERVVRAFAHRLEIARPSVLNVGAERRTERSRPPVLPVTFAADSDLPSVQTNIAPNREPSQLDRPSPGRPRRLVFPYDANAPPHTA